MKKIYCLKNLLDIIVHKKNCPNYFQNKYYSKTFLIITNFH